MKRKKDRIEELLREYFTGRRKPPEDEEAQAGLFHLAEPGPSQAAYDAEMPEEGPPIIREVSAPRIRKKNCPCLEDLAAFIEGVIDKKMGMIIEDHLALCPDCSNKCKSGSDTLDRHSRGKSNRTPDDLSEETSSLLDELYHESRSPTEDEDDL